MAHQCLTFRSRLWAVGRLNFDTSRHNIIDMLLGEEEFAPLTEEEQLDFAGTWWGLERSSKRGCVRVDGWRGGEEGGVGSERAGHLSVKLLG